MEAVISSGKRFLSMLTLIITLGNPAVFSPVGQWAVTWWTHRSSILLLTGVNISITTGSEFVSRSIFSQVQNRSEHKFFVKNQSGKWSIHRQSMVNIFMTLFISLFGGPVYFIGHRWRRILFFLSFGAVNSVASQLVVNIFREGSAAISLGRLLFDLGYLGTIKIWMFEFARPAILYFQKNVAGVGAIRIVQDFLMTMIRVGLLNWFGFK